MSSTLNLSPYASIETAFFIKLTVDNLGVPQIIRMSTHRVPLMITESDNVAYSYDAIGSILNVSEIVADNKPTLNDISITLSGIPNTYIAEVLETLIKGAPVEIRQAYFSPATGQLLNVTGNPSLNFSGIVTNYTLDEGWTDDTTQAVTTAVVIVCSSIVSVLQRKVSGRRTNQSDQTYWFAGDDAMNRVSVISEQVFDFGGTTPSVTPQASPGTTINT